MQPERSAAQSFRKKPVVIQAMQFDGSRPSIEACCRWVNDGAKEPILDYIFTGPADVRDAFLGWRYTLGIAAGMTFAGLWAWRYDHVR